MKNIHNRIQYIRITHDEQGKYYVTFERDDSTKTYTFPSEMALHRLTQLTNRYQVSCLLWNDDMQVFIHNSKNH